MNLRIVSLSIFLFFFFYLYAAISMTPVAVPSNLHVYDEVGNTYVDHVVDGCGSYRYWINPENANYEAIMSILLTAQVSGKKVILRYDGCVNGGNQGRVIGVYLKN
mgnify:CR=1 FL=1